MSPRRKPWDEAAVVGVRAAVKAELDAVEAASGRAARLQHALRQVTALADDLASDALLRRYTYVMSALVHHERHGGLGPRHVRSLAELATSLLQLQGVDPLHSKAAYLYGEVHLVLSQIHRRQGRAWEALWEQQLSLHFAAEAPVNGPGPQLVATGIRLLRSGDAAGAVTAFAGAEEWGLSARLHEQARLGRVKALRLAARLDEAEALASVPKDLSVDGERELAWERLCINVVRAGDVSPLLAATDRRRGTHATGDYLLECWLWTRAAPKKSLLAATPKLSTLVRNGTLEKRKHGAFLKAALVLEQCHDTAVPFLRRLTDLGHALADAGRLISVDKELLLWAAAARWLHRADQPMMASVALREYAALGLRLTDGRTADALGLMRDVLEKPLLEKKLAKLKKSA